MAIERQRTVAKLAAQWQPFHPSRRTEGALCHAAILAVYRLRGEWLSEEDPGEPSFERVFVGTFVIHDRHFPKPEELNERTFWFATDGEMWAFISPPVPEVPDLRPTLDNIAVLDRPGEFILNRRDQARVRKAIEKFLSPL